MQDDHGAARFAWRRWGENGVVFDRRFGNTHTLSGAAALVFDAWLTCGSLELDELARSLKPGKIDDSTLDRPKLAEALHELQQCGLLPKH